MNKPGQAAADRIALHRAFAARFAVKSTSNPQSNIPPTEHQLDSIENDLQVKFPDAYRMFVLLHGTVWTPHLSDALPRDTEKIYRGIEDFTPIEKLVAFNQGWESSLPSPLLLFAGGDSGDMFGFPKQETPSDDLPISVFDPNFSEIERVADSFDQLLSTYLNMPAS
jgi:hypothetical protein